MANSPCPVLLVDDSDDDRLFLRRILRRAPEIAVIGEAHDGGEAIAYLSGEEEFRDRGKHPFPDIMILDLKMPRKTGFDVLEWLRSHPFPRRLSVVVMSSSPLAGDISRSLALGAAAYHQKSSLREDQKALLRAIQEMAAARQAAGG